MASTPHRTTIAEVAAQAGVSAATVSRVMNGRPVRDAALAERVRAAAAALHYRPSPLARGLALGRTRTIAFVVPDLANPAFQAMLSALSRTAGHDRYRVLVADTAEDPADEPEIVADVRRRCDALILCAPRMTDDELMRVAAELAPLVVINRTAPDRSVPSLSIDYATGIRLLTDHLHGLGHRRLVYVRGPLTSASDAGRRRGLAQFEAEHPDVTVQKVAGGTSIDDGRRAAAAVAASGATGVLAFNDLVAIGLLEGLREHGVRVPEDLSVTGFDDIPFARHTSPRLTTASVPHGELGAQAWHRVHALIAERAPDHDVVFLPRLEVRDSSGAPPAPVAAVATGT